MADWLKLTICGCFCELEKAELMRWIVSKYLQYGSRMTARASKNGTAEVSGILQPMSVDRTQQEKTRSSLVRLYNPFGQSWVCDAKHLISIEIETSE